MKNAIVLLVFLTLGFTSCTKESMNTEFLADVPPAAAEGVFVNNLSVTDVEVADFDITDNIRVVGEYTRVTSNQIEEFKFNLDSTFTYQRFYQGNLVEDVYGTFQIFDGTDGNKYITFDYAVVGGGSGTLTWVFVFMSDDLISVRPGWVFEKV